MAQMMLSAGIVPIYIADKPEFLLLRAYRYWDFPKGLVETNESPFDAALRELHEETGIKDVRFTWGKRFFETEPYSRGKIARYYVGRVLSKDVILSVNEELGRQEHMQFLWLPYAKAKSLVVLRVGEVLDWANHLISTRLIS